MADYNHHPHASVFERINVFMGEHVECIYDERRIRYDLSFVADSDTCVVALSCGCGETVSLVARQSVGREIASMTRTHDIPMTECVTPWAEAPRVLGVKEQGHLRPPARVELATSHDRFSHRRGN